MELGKWLRVAWDRAAALAVIVIGAVVVIIGWIGVSGEPYPAKQLPFMMSGGVGGMFLLGVGALFWLSSDLRDEWTKLDRIEEALVRLSGTDLVEPEALTPAAEPLAAEPQLAKVAE
jgi:multisubunit Na+/H+ antiporter MnhB subunit